MSFLHAFVSAAPEDPDPLKIKTSNWNAEHDVDLSDEYTSAVHLDLRAYATGDGSTNDTAGVASAVTAAIALGACNIFIAPNKTFLTDRIFLSAISAKLRFYGGGTLKLRTTGNALIEMAGGTGKVKLDNIVLDGNNLALTSNAWALAIATGTGDLEGQGIEVKNVGVALSGAGGGIASNTGAKLKVAWSTVHDTHGMGIHVQGTGKADISHNTLYNIYYTAIFVGPNNNGGTDVFSDGYIVGYNIINDIFNDPGGSGASGNGINCFRNSNGSVIGNQITNVAFSFIRINDCDEIAITANRCKTAGEAGAYCEFRCNNAVWTGNVFKDMQTNGLDFTNVTAGVTGLMATGNKITGFGLATPVTSRFCGLCVEYSIATGNYVDGQNNPGATWGYRVGTGAGTSTPWQAQVENNQVAGCKYDVGVAVSVAGGIQRMVIGGIMNVRQDANYSAPIGGIAGNTTDGGNASAIGAAMGLKIRWTNPLWDCTAANAPPPGEAGSLMKIGGVVHYSDGVAWRPQLTVSSETITYSASMTPGTFSTMSRVSTITATNTTAFTINAIPGTPVTGALQTFVIRRSSASALGALTWNAIYKVGTWTQPSANTTSRSVTFQYNGTNWVEITRTSVDVPN